MWAERHPVELLAELDTLFGEIEHALKGVVEDLDDMADHPLDWENLDPPALIPPEVAQGQGPLWV